MMTEQEFENLWQRAEALPHADGLMEEYPSWQRNRRNRLWVTASLVVATAVALPLLTHPRFSSSDDAYIAAYCNRSDIADQYWVNMADELLRDV